jgi:hypothetical protein
VVSSSVTATLQSKRQASLPERDFSGLSTPVEDKASEIRELGAKAGVGFRVATAPGDRYP